MTLHPEGAKIFPENFFFAPEVKGEGRAPRSSLQGTGEWGFRYDKSINDNWASRGTTLSRQNGHKKARILRYNHTKRPVLDYTLLILSLQEKTIAIGRTLR